MGTLGALTLLIALAAIIYVFSPRHQVPMAKELAAIEIPQHDSIKNLPTDEAKPTSSHS
jgi:hypothetical protein